MPAILKVIDTLSSIAPFELVSDDNDFLRFYINILILNLHSDNLLLVEFILALLSGCIIIYIN